MSVLPQALPPAAFGAACATKVHLVADIRDVPSGERRERLRFALLSLAHLLAVAVGATRHLFRERVAEDVAALEVASVRGFLENEVFREVLAVVADVEPGDERVLRSRFAAAWGDVRCRSRTRRARGVDSRTAGRRHTDRTTTCPTRTRGKRCACSLCGLAGEHRFVEIAKLVFDEHRKVHPGRKLHRAVVRGLDAPVARERVEDEILWAVGGDGAEPDGKHELGRLERDLERSQVVEPELRLLFQVDLGHEETNVLADVELASTREAPGGVR